MIALSINEFSSSTKNSALSQFDALEDLIDAIPHRHGDAPVEAVTELVAIGEEVLEIWLRARGEEPTRQTKEGFRILALHRQGARGEPSFNACRETCRELVYQYNLVVGDPHNSSTRQRVAMAALVAKHLCLFVSGKYQVEGLGDFCCASKPVRAAEAALPADTAPKTP